jgi:hypothetical protein
MGRPRWTPSAHVWRIWTCIHGRQASSLSPGPEQVMDSARCSRACAIDSFNERGFGSACVQILRFWHACAGITSALILAGRTTATQQPRAPPSVQPSGCHFAHHRCDHCPLQHASLHASASTRATPPGPHQAFAVALTSPYPLLLTPLAATAPSRCFQGRRAVNHNFRTLSRDSTPLAPPSTHHSAPYHLRRSAILPRCAVRSRSRPSRCYTIPAVPDRCPSAHLRNQYTLATNPQRSAIPHSLR